MLVAGAIDLVADIDADATPPDLAGMIERPRHGGVERLLVFIPAVEVFADTNVRVHGSTQKARRSGRASAPSRCASCQRARSLVVGLRPKSGSVRAMARVSIERVWRSANNLVVPKMMKRMMLTTRGGNSGSGERKDAAERVLESAMHAGGGGGSGRLRLWREAGASRCRVPWA